ncbi:MAG: biopolymer transporter ExbD [Spirochaetaceae bacterium]|jgi:biopolymer transport protein ExbD|nr:biopolymer transporter ExbD [Spirochaetaceae bacterium]
MKIKRRRKRSFPESSATSDIAFLLIIYFIVIAGFNVNKGFLINLPAKDSTRMVKKDDVLRYQLDAAGNILFNDTQVSIHEVETGLRNALAEHPNLALMLIISPQALWQNVVSIVEIAEKLRVDSFSFRIETVDALEAAQ